MANLRGIKVTAYTYTGGIAASVLTDSNGYYRMHVDPGKYILEFRDIDDKVFMTQYYGNASYGVAFDIDSASNFLLGENEKKIIDVILAR